VKHTIQGKNKKKVKILITGGSGFIGTNLIDSLVNKGYDVLNIDKAKPLDHKQNIFWRNLNIMDLSNLEHAVSEYNPHYLIHLAAKADLKGQTLADYNENIEGVDNIIRAIKRCRNIKKIVFASTTLVCEAGYTPINNRDYAPGNLYGESKKLGEIIVWDNDLLPKWVIVRPTSIWGPWIVKTSYNLFFKMIMTRQYFNISKKRSGVKTFGFVLNLVYQIETLLFNDLDRGVFYLGDKKPYVVSEWADEISYSLRKKKNTKIPFFILKLLALLGDLLNKFNIQFPINSFRLMNMTIKYVTDIDQELFNQEPYTRKQGVELTLKWFRDYYKT
jgi:nucleoside-diphosphate-sugar epimerase